MYVFPKDTHLVTHGFKKPDSIYNLNSADNTDVAKVPYVPNIKALYRPSLCLLWFYSQPEPGVKRAKMKLNTHKSVSECFTSDIFFSVY